MEKLRDVIFKHALANAYSYGGKASPGSVVGKILAEMPEQRKDMKGLQKAIAEVVKEVNEIPVEFQEKKLREIYPEFFEKKPEVKKELPELPGAKPGKVVTRLAPEPNGYLHLGHAISFYFNEHYAKKYKGKLWLRFEDTNPQKEKQEYYDAIKEDLEWLGIKYDKEKNNSADLPIFYEKAEQMLERGQLYVCTCPVEKSREMRFKGEDCEHKKQSAEDNLVLWKKMHTDFKPGEAVVRLVGDMKAKNTVMRDPTMFRIVEGKHPTEGGKYRVWPLYDFANSIEDAICGITHVLRSNEFKQRDELQNFIRNCLGLKNPEIISYSRIQVSDSPTSKREILKLMDEGKIQAWDDPRLVTIKALKRRGILPETLRKLSSEVRMTSGSTTIDWKTLSGVNRKLLDQQADRYSFVPNPVKLKVKKAPEKLAKLKLHPDHPDRGARKIKTNGIFFISRDDMSKEFRLKDLYNVHNNEYDGDELKPRLPKVQWVTEDNVEVEVIQPEKGLETVKGLAEESVKGLKPGNVVQFERFGFVRIDEADGKIRAVLAHK